MGLFGILAIFLLLVIFNKYLFWWLKATIVVYYSVISYFFVTTKNKIDREYENILALPDAYWDKNSDWGDTLLLFYFLPMAFILFFYYCKWFTVVKSRMAKVLVAVSFFPSAFIFLFFTVMFSFSYGYRP